MKKSDLLIVIPAYNEEESILTVVENLETNFPQFDYVIVNDGSKDKTGEICHQKHTKISSEEISDGRE